MSSECITVLLHDDFTVVFCEMNLFNIEIVDYLLVSNKVSSATIENRVM